jgi:hypothetical protein
MHTPSYASVCRAVLWTPIQFRFEAARKISTGRMTEHPRTWSAREIDEWTVDLVTHHGIGEHCTFNTGRTPIHGVSKRLLGGDCRYRRCDR